MMFVIGGYIGVSVRERTLLWWLQNAIAITISSFYYYLKRGKNILIIAYHKKKVVFLLRLAGSSGGVIAFSSIANMLAKRMNMGGLISGKIINIQHVVVTAINAKLRRIKNQSLVVTIIAMVGKKHGC